MPTDKKALEAAKKAPGKRTVEEQKRVDDNWNQQEIRNTDFAARGERTGW